MTQLDAILDAGRQQLSLDELLAVIEEENRGEAPPEMTATVEIGAIEDISVATEGGEIGPLSHCEVEAQCYEARGIEAWKEKRGQRVQIYRCGYIGAGTVKWCAKRKRLRIGMERHR